MASTWDEEKKKCPWYVAARKISECCREPMSSDWQDRQHHGPYDCAWQERVLHGAQHDDRVRLSLQVLADSSNKEAHGNSLKPATLTIDTRNSTSDNRLVKTSEKTAVEGILLPHSVDTCSERGETVKGTTRAEEREPGETTDIVPKRRNVKTRHKE